MLTEGQTIENYQLLRKLGEGAFGEVWAVKHVELGAVRAMKIPTDADCVKQLRKEGQIQFDVKHPNIVETVDLNTHHDPPYYVMEYVDGQDLRKVLAAKGKLAAPEALRVLRQLLEALQAAHAHGVLHRDLKPENVLLTADGTVKVADFGLGRVQSDVAQSLVLSGSMMSVEGKSVSGTYAYMSPEQQAGQASDPRDDIYAVGIMACELLTGHRPSGVGVAKIFRREGIDAALSEMVEKALDEPAQRYASAGEMLGVLRGVETRFAGPRAAPLGRRPPPPPRRAAPPPPPAKLTVDEPVDVVPTLDAVPALPGGASWPAAMPRWRNWLWSSGERAAQAWLVAAGIMGFVVGGATQDQHNFAGVLYVGSAVWIGCAVAVARARSRYNLACAEACLGSGDYVAGLAYARKIRRRGVDGSRARVAIAGLAALAAQSGDPERARELGLLAQGWVLIPAGGQPWSGPSAPVPLRAEADPRVKAFGGQRLAVVLVVVAGVLGLSMRTGGDSEVQRLALVAVAPAAAVLYGWLTCRGTGAFVVSIVLAMVFGSSASVESSHGRLRFYSSEDWVILVCIAVAGGICGAVAAAIRRHRRRRKGLPPM